MKKLIGGLIAGAALGIAAGILMAPASGEKTRRKLVKGGAKMKNNVVTYIDDSIDNLRDQLTEKIDQYSKKGKEAINHVSERVKI